jgi:hypothetical protein
MKLSREMATSQMKLSREMAAANHDLTFRLKQADVLQTMNLRYEKLWDVRRNPQQGDNAEVFFTQYWNLQVDQFQAWITDLIPDSVYRTWMVQRGSDFQRDWAFQSMKFSDGWAKCCPLMATQGNFRKLVDELRHPNSDIDGQLQKIKPTYRTSPTAG